MKRILFVIILIFAAAPAIAASLPSEIRFTIEKALANEREAIARYDAFAAKADLEGYPGAASLFRAEARAERVHAQRFEKLLRDEGLPVPPEVAVTVNPGDTGDNLRAAASAETAERDGIYHEAIEVSHRHKANAIATAFDQTRDSEVEHANLCMAAARDLGSMKEAKTYYVCTRCGYTTDFSMRLCAVCRAKEEPERVK
ncbi:MAG: rubrerythrin family protein [Thermoanaerobaculia bacterium]|nr:rubrerythrin family protein [Thermoanaerobaculia bacterium]